MNKTDPTGTEDVSDFNTGLKKAIERVYAAHKLAPDREQTVAVDQKFVGPFSTGYSISKVFQGDERTSPLGQAVLDAGGFLMAGVHAHPTRNSDQVASSEDMNSVRAYTTNLSKPESVYIAGERVFAWHEGDRVQASKTADGGSSNYGVGAQIGNIIDGKYSPFKQPVYNVDTTTNILRVR